MLVEKINYKVAIYVRLSRDDERVGDSVSIENQKIMLMKHCELQGWNQYVVYSDDGYTGLNFERPAFIQMMEDAKMGEIDLILCKDLSRFGRNFVLIGQYTDYIFPMLGVRFIAIHDNVDTLQDDNDIMPFRNLFNEFQSKDTSKKIKVVKQTHAKLGNYLGCYVPYGYKAHPEDKHKFIVDPYAAEVVKKMFAYRLQGFGYRKIAGALNEEKILPPRDYYYQQAGKESKGYRNHLWNDVTLKKMLRNEVYIGHMVQNKRGTLSYKNKKQIDKPKEEWIRVENTHEAIIDLTTWNACVEIDARKYKPRSTKETNTPSLFGGLVVCLDCGFKMRYNVEKHQRKNGKVAYKSYLCGNYSRSGKGACSSHIMYENPLIEIILDDIHRRANRVLEDENAVRELLLKSKAKDQERLLKADKSEVKILEKRLAELNKLTQSLYEDKVLGSVPETVFTNLMVKYEEERLLKSGQLEEIKLRLDSFKQDENDIEKYLESIKKYVAVEMLDRELLLELIQFIEIGERKVLGKQKFRDVVIHYNLVDQAG